PGGGADGELTLALCNDTDDRWVGRALLRRVTDAGSDTARRVVPVDVPPRSVRRVLIAADVAVFDEPASEVLVAEFDGMRAWWYATEARASGFVGAPPVVRAEPF